MSNTLINGTQIDPGTITDTQIAAANKDGAAGTASMRTLGTGATQAGAGNDGRFTDSRTPLAHTTSHKHGGTDEVSTATPTANAIPKADASSKLDGWTTTTAHLTNVEDSSGQRIFTSVLSPGPAGFILLTGIAYFVYLGRTVQSITPKFVEFHVSTIAAGGQTAEVGFFSTPNPPNKTAQSLTKLVSTATVDALTGLGVKRNTSAFATAVAAGTHLWAGIRTAMATTQPTIWGLALDMAQGNILSLAASGVLTGAGPFSGGIIAASTSVSCPDLRGTLD